ncbi:MAG: bifunctional methylenetetrahydrofolate dehydrogenase/methenyltetrahydrofolate cyclohydrolase, partial [Caldilineae bacterium]
MSAQIIDGKAIAATIRGEIKQEVEEMKARYGRVPGLAAVLVGDRPDSATYVRMKKKACAEVGITSFGYELPADISQEDLLKVVRDLNDNPDVHGILVQLPLPDHIDEEEILGAISIEKDVDGFHPLNIGRLSMKRREPLFVPCT